MVSLSIAQLCYNTKVPIDSYDMVYLYLWTLKFKYYIILHH